MTVKVIVLGPNGINDCSFHVHAHGCADVSKSRYRFVDGARDHRWVKDIESEQELFEDMFGDFIAENRGKDYGGKWEDYENDARVFPCVNGLRRNR